MIEINRNQEVTFMLHSNDRIVKHKVGLLNLADELGNISKACKMMGVSRDTFYRYQEAVNEGGVEALLAQNRRVPNHKNRVDPAVESAVVEYAIKEPAHYGSRPAERPCAAVLCF